MAAPKADGPVPRNGAVYYDESPWRGEFQTYKSAPDKEKAILLRDGSQVVVGRRYTNPGFYVIEGKQWNVATGSLFMAPGLDGIEEVHRDPASDTRIFVVDRHGGHAAYDDAGSTHVTADLSGSKGRTAAQVGAVMAGTRRRAGSVRDHLHHQYREVYDAYMDDRCLANLIRATDAFYALARAQGLCVGYSHDATEEALRWWSPDKILSPDGALADVVARRGTPLVSEMSELLRRGLGASAEDQVRFLSRLGALSTDVDTHVSRLQDEISRARATVELAELAARALLERGER